ncbi:MAG TPA: phosphatase PAP2 family protein [Bdellovibrionota bacterium]|jgi:membrane-associated phospholipid phosphatase|nr:phosphatase PAP2 family protein [Bdellovibrionota bacterium]
MSEITGELLADRAKAGGLWHQVPDSLVIWDQRAFDALVSQDPTSGLHHFADQMAHHWPGIAMLVGVLLALGAIKTRNGTTTKALLWELVGFLIILGVGNMLSDELKALFARLKPHISHDIPGVKQPLSFPSNHSFNTATILGFWLVNLRHLPSRSVRNASIALLTLVWAFTAWTRVYLGEHFPLDVIAGFIFGFAYGAYGAWLLSRVLLAMGKHAKQ